MSAPSSAYLYQPEMLGNEFSVLIDFLETLDEGSLFTTSPAMTPSFIHLVHRLQHLQHLHRKIHVHHQLPLYHQPFLHQLPLHRHLALQQLQVTLTFQFLAHRLRWMSM
ncbi:hypothetical protein EDD22DRAFT_325496 [Suillus occidentalis]|nr:hypothetical protein EDD22DRAFT_325496 [Suillus occidentalis]